MRLKKLISLDFIFLYISIFLIIWMVLSNLANRSIDTENAFTKRVRAGYEIRSYNGTIIGAEITENKNISFWMRVREVKSDIESKGVDLIDYPFLIKNENDVKKVFFFSEDKSIKNISNYIIKDIDIDTAFSSFMWYPTSNNQKKNHSLLIDILSNEKTEFNTEDYWVEIYHPWYVIPFEMRNGVGVELK